jgi:hypothetical protein
MVAFFEATWYNVALVAYLGLSALPMFFGQSKVNLNPYYSANVSKPAHPTGHIIRNKKLNKSTKPYNDPNYPQNI